MLPADKPGVYASSFAKGFFHISPENREKKGTMTMNYTVRKTKEAAKTYKDNNGGKWPCILPEQYKKLPKSQKRICGDMRKQDSGSLERTLLVETGETSQVIGLYEYQARKKWNETVVGYIPAAYGEDEQPCCVRIVGVSVLQSVRVPPLVMAGIGGLVLGWLWYGREDEVPGLDETAVAYRMEGLVNTDPDNTMIPMISDITVSASEGHADNVLINPEGNGCYFIYSITRNDTGEVLYESGLVEPGKAIVGFDLGEIPEPSEYEVTVAIETRDVNNYEQELNGGDMQTTLTVTE